MTFTNAELVRQLAGDSGTPTRDAISADGSTLTYYLFAPPIIGNSQVVYVNDSPLTEVPSAPAGGQYAIDDETGRVSFGTAPTVGTDNVVVTYKAARLVDAAVTEACRQYGLTSTATADTGRSPDALLAAALCCDWLAAMTAADFDFETDGQSFKRGSISKSYADRAVALRAEARTQSGITSVPVTRIDGYSSKGEYTSRDYSTTAANPRRQFYGEEDEIP
jgi:hypothetical protein